MTSQTCAIEPSTALKPVSRQFSRVLFFSCMVLGVLQVAGEPFSLGADGLAYLDLSDQVLHQHWLQAANLCWSPLYPALIACSRMIMHADRYWEVPAIKLLNLVIYSFAAFSLTLLVEALDRIRTTNTTDGIPQPSFGFSAISFVSFTWLSLGWIRAYWVSPDMLVLSFVLFEIWLYLWQRTRPFTFSLGAAIGFVFGLSYWAKTILLPFSFALLLVLLWERRRIKSEWPKLGAASALFLLTITPLAAAMSWQNGSFTFGQSGVLNYSWFVNGTTPYKHWQGQNPGSGTPAHPTHRLLQSPPMYSFGSIADGTYAPWDDPAYWYKGMYVYWQSSQLKQAVKANANRFVRIGTRTPLAAAAFSAWLIYVLLSGPVSNERLRRLIPLLAVLCLPLMLYLLVSVRARYLAPFLASAAVLISALLDDAPKLWRSLCERLMLLPAGFLVVGLLVSDYRALDIMARRLQAGQPLNQSWHVAQVLSAAGLKPGASVGTVGLDFSLGWARAGAYHVEAEVIDPNRFSVPEGAYRFHPLFTDSEWPEVEDRFRESKIQVIVADGSAMPVEVRRTLRRIDQTNLFFTWVPQTR